MRLALLASIAWVTRLNKSAFYNIQSGISARDLILLLGGLFLIWKAARKSTNPLKVKKKAENTRFIIPRRYRADYAAGYYL